MSFAAFSFSVKRGGPVAPWRFILVALPIHGLADPIGSA